MKPVTVFEIIQLLQQYHQRRQENYQRLAEGATDERTATLLNHLVELEAMAQRIIGSELSQLSPDHSTYLSSGPELNIDPAHAADCRCGSAPSFEDALGCALTSDLAVFDMIDRLGGSSAAASVQELATRLRELEETKDRQIARFTRPD